MKIFFKLIISVSILILLVIVFYFIINLYFAYKMKHSQVEGFAREKKEFYNNEINLEILGTLENGCISAIDKNTNITILRFKAINSPNVILTKGDTIFKYPNSDKLYKIVRGEKKQFDYKFCD